MRSLNRDRGGFVKFLLGDEGQDLVEYSLLLAFICLAGAAAFIGMGQSTTALWSVANSRLAAANQTSGS
jgi:Flp pilus assembly pilin Flp